MYLNTLWPTIVLDTYKYCCTCIVSTVHIYNLGHAINCYRINIKAVVYYIHKTDDAREQLTFTNLFGGSWAEWVGRGGMTLGHGLQIASLGDQLSTVPKIVHHKTADVEVDFQAHG